MAMRVAKHQYFSALIAFADNHLMTLFRITQTLLGVLEVYLQGCAEEFSLYLMDEIAQISFSVGYKGWMCVEMSGEWTYPVIWK